MTKRVFVFGSVLGLLLSGCGEDPPPRRDAPSVAASPEPAPAPVASEEPPEPSGGGITSAYTKYNLDNCEVLRAEEFEGESLETRCAGYQDAPLYVNVGDGRFDIDVGVTNEFQTIGPFNELGETIEWRLKDGKPFAVIARLKDVSMESGGNSALIVETVGSAGKAGCRIAHVWNSRPNQNAVAREIADQSLAPGFGCPAEPRRIE